MSWSWRQLVEKLKLLLTIFFPTCQGLVVCFVKSGPQPWSPTYQTLLPLNRLPLTITLSTWLKVAYRKLCPGKELPVIAPGWLVISCRFKMTCIGSVSYQMTPASYILVWQGTPLARYCTHHHCAVLSWILSLFSNNLLARQKKKIKKRRANMYFTVSLPNHLVCVIRWTAEHLWRW